MLCRGGMHTHTLVSSFCLLLRWKFSSLMRRLLSSSARWLSSSAPVSSTRIGLVMVAMIGGGLLYLALRSAASDPVSAWSTNTTQHLGSPPQLSNNSFDKPLDRQESVASTTFGPLGTTRSICRTELTQCTWGSSNGLGLPAIRSHHDVIAAADRSITHSMIHTLIIPPIQLTHSLTHSLTHHYRKTWIMNHSSTPAAYEQTPGYSSPCG